MKSGREKERLKSEKTRELARSIKMEGIIQCVMYLGKEAPNVLGGKAKLGYLTLIITSNICWNGLRKMSEKEKKEEEKTRERLQG